MITEFQGEFRWLSNFWPCQISFGGMFYPSVEHAYQAAKVETLGDKELISRAKTPGSAKRIGHYVKKCENWDTAKLRVMLELLRKKFSIPELREKLLATYDQHLEEGNKWGDEFWGINLRNGKGENWLGQLIMKVRDELQKDGVF